MLPDRLVLQWRMAAARSLRLAAAPGPEPAAGSSCAKQVMLCKRRIPGCPHPTPFGRRAARATGGFIWI
ncbi:hypothetical protein LIP_1209 [Limnochorda pilosa]|uniref:Uncharacterized protein n=1 Tax=Limnochorda pilosa TaxID=1555112 RepID=A0A0K2SIW2_LIMPI|nr:hypothetical protein LIP_1209 [Limnochorda pilosa]